MLTNNEIKFIRTLHSKRGRDGAMLFIAEGEKLVGELSAHFEVEHIYSVGENCTEAQMAKISQLKTPSPQLALLKIPKVGALTTVNRKGRVLVLDRVQDPGNLGTILRTCLWFGVRTVVCSEHTVDIYSSKVVQSTMGALGRVEVVYTDIERWLTERKELFPKSIYGTFLSHSEELSNVTFHPSATIVMGNEGSGISASVEQIVENRVHISRGEGGEGESLNVAIAAALMLRAL